MGTLVVPPWIRAAVRSRMSGLYSTMDNGKREWGPIPRFILAKTIKYERGLPTIFKRDGEYILSVDSRGMF